MNFTNLLIVIIGVSLSVFIFYFFVKEIVIHPLIENNKYKQKRKRWDIENPDKKRKLCKDCKYSVSETMFAGKYPNGIPMRAFSHCKLTKRSLKGNRATLRCMLAVPTEELIAENEALLPSSDSNVFFSAYGDTYHSTSKCPSIKNSTHIYNNRLGTLDRRYCPKCWVTKNGKLYPKNNNF